jgi:hypothetical protein
VLKPKERDPLAGRLTIIGGGVMRLMTAYHAAPLAVQQSTAYDIGRFTPARFAAEGVAS